VRITEVLHEANQDSQLTSAFTNLRTAERCQDPNAPPATMPGGATNLGAIFVMSR
jgi:hypothetical protein